MTPPKLDLAVICPELAEILEKSLELRKHPVRYARTAAVAFLPDQVDSIVATMLAQQAKIEGMEKTLKRIQDYCDLGLVLFLQSNRFEHLVKLVDNILGGETAKDRWGGAARKGGATGE